MNAYEYNRRVAHNTQIAKKHLQEHGSAGLLSMLPELYSFEKKCSELHVVKLVANAWDIIPAVLLQYLPSVARNGADGVALVDNNFVELEFKWASCNSDAYWMTNIRKPVIYTGKENTRANRASLRSNISGKFTVHTEACVASKKRQTILLVSENNCPDCLLLDAYELDANTTYKYLSGYNNMGKLRVTKNREVKLGTFMKYGYSVKDRCIVDDGVRFESYEEAMFNNLPSIEDWKNGACYMPTYQELLGYANGTQSSKSSIVPQGSCCAA